MTTFSCKKATVRCCHQAGWILRRNLPLTGMMNTT